MDALFERLAAAYGLLVAILALLPAARTRALGAAGATLVGLAAAADAAAGSAPTPQFATVNELLAAAGLALVVLALVLGWGRRASEPGEPFGAPPAGPFNRGSLGLGVSLVVLLILIDPEGARLRLLGEQPLRYPAERVAVLLIGGIAFALAGLAPLHRAPWGRQLAPLAAIVLLRMVAAFPSGLLAWQVPAMLLLVLSLSWAALAGRWTEVAVAAGLFALWSGVEAGRLPGLALVLWGWLGEWWAAVAGRRGVQLLPRWAGIPALPAALVALPALTASLHAQVLLSVLAVVAAMTGFVSRATRRPRGVKPPL